MTGEGAALSHWIAAGAFALFALVLLLARRGAANRWLALAAAVMAAWAAALAYGSETGRYFALTVSVGETLRASIWIVFLAALMRL
ncbi:MAG: hypothetical protein WA979_10865, partial [Pacificimonas sp.]